MKYSQAFQLACAIVLAIVFSNAEPEPAKQYANGRIIDITHQIRAGLPEYGNNHSTSGPFLEAWSPFNRTLPNQLKTQNFGIHIPCHISTHVDAPSHAVPKWEDGGYDVDSLDLETLNGPVLLIEAPRDKNLTAEVLQSLNIPKGERRVLFKTSNTDRELMWKIFESNYTGFTLDGAQWLVDNTDIKLVGIDYLSIAIGSRAQDYVPPHQVLLEKRDIIPLEGLNLLGVPAGRYDIHCLPLRIAGADGAPARCILIKS